MDWEQRVLNTLAASRPTYDAPPDWRTVLALYEGLSRVEARQLDQTFLKMIDEDYRNPHSSGEQDPFEDVLMTLPAGMRSDDLLCIEVAVLVAAERGLDEAFFAFNRLMRAPRWHALYPRLQWLSSLGLSAQQRLAGTRGGRSYGAFLGLAVGDALGATVEFMNRAEVKKLYPEGHREIVGGGPFRFAAGEWTDDTAMALAVAMGIAEAPDDPVPAVGRHFLTWYESGPPDVGNTCRFALEAYKQKGSWGQASAEVAAAFGDRAGGNGALMRTLPSAIAYGPETDQASAIGAMTHPHSESDSAVRCYHRMVDMLLDGADREAALDAGLEAAGALATRLAEAPGRPEEQVRAGGYVVDTLEAAIWAFMGATSLEEVVVRAVNLGEDADTVGAIAGGLAGAFFGPAAVPRRWSIMLRGREVLESVTEGLVRLHSIRYIT